MPPSKTNIHKNHLYALRRSRGYGQKQLAYLLGQHGAQMISRYEAGTVLPSLQTALMLEIVLGARLPEIYRDLYCTLAKRARLREERLPITLGRHIGRRVCDQDNCSNDNSGHSGSDPRALPTS